MKHAVCTLSPVTPLLVTHLPAKDAVQLALVGRDMPPRLVVFEVADDATLDTPIPDDAPVVWFFRSSRKEG